jgi:hypothetical protein
MEQRGGDGGGRGMEMGMEGASDRDGIERGEEGGRGRDWGPHSYGQL